MTLTDEEKQKIEEEEAYRKQVAANNPKAQQKHGVPALLSFFIPGLGQIVKGQVGKGVFAFLGVGIGLVVLVIPGVIIWIWQIVDAYND